MQATRVIASAQSHDAATGSWGSNPAFESVEAFDRLTCTEVVLSDDNPKSVAFGDMATASLVFVEVVNGGAKVRARLTSADGNAQAIAVDPILQILSRSVPYTALDLTRAAGSSSPVRVRVALAAPPA